MRDLDAGEGGARDEHAHLVAEGQNAVRIAHTPLTEAAHAAVALAGAREHAHRVLALSHCITLPLYRTQRHFYIILYHSRYHTHSLCITHSLYHILSSRIFT